MAEYPTAAEAASWRGPDHPRSVPHRSSNPPSLRATPTPYGFVHIEHDGEYIDVPPVVAIELAAQLLNAAIMVSPDHERRRQALIRAAELGSPVAATDEAVRASWRTPR